MAVTRARPSKVFFTVVASQFLSSMADNALLIAAIGLLMQRHAAEWTAPALRLFFYLSYVVLAAFAGAVADALPKSRVMLLTNLVKCAGCVLLLLQVHPLLAYALVGAGAAAYSPAKYGILPELLPADQLVSANAWIEASTVLSILLGVLLGSVLLDEANALPQWGGTRASTAVLFIGVVYLLSVLCAAAIPHGKPSNPAALGNLQALPREFFRSWLILWRDRQSQASLAVTSLFWAASATLQFMVLRWAERVLQLALSEAALLQAAVAIGMVTGAVAAARWIPMRRALSVLPLGVAVGLIVLGMAWVTQVWVAVLLLVCIGALSGLVVVPMNALLQHRGQLLMHSGQSIAVQNFNESLVSLVFLAMYGALLYFEVALLDSIIGFGLFVCAAMLLILVGRWTRVRAVGYLDP